MNLYTADLHLGHLNMKFVNGCETVNVNINVNTDKPVYNNADNETELHNETGSEGIPQD